MSYGTFKSVAEVARKFKIKVKKRVCFVGVKQLVVSKHRFSEIEEELRDDTNYVSEYAICESIIRPVLKVVIKNYSLKIWSHVSYDVDTEKGLFGKPDYLIAPLTEYSDMGRPALCIIEAKKDNFDEGWTQAFAEMVASSLLGATTCYGIVSAGSIWQFGKLEAGVFTIDAISLSATENLQRVFDTTNWVFNKISLLY